MDKLGIETEEGVWAIERMKRVLREISPMVGARFIITGDRKTARIDGIMEEAGVVTGCFEFKSRETIGKNEKGIPIPFTEEQFIERGLLISEDKLESGRVCSELLKCSYYVILDLAVANCIYIAKMAVNGEYVKEFSSFRSKTRTSCADDEDIERDNVIIDYDKFEQIF